MGAKSLGLPGGERGIVASAVDDVGAGRALDPRGGLGARGEGRAGFPGVARGAGRRPKKRLLCRKVRKVGKVLSVMTRPRFLTFPTFLALGPRKRAAG